jgi:photosynthetic reaction center H subunit
MNYLNSGVDWALIVTYAFWLFFAGLILYLRREDRREGYPLEHDNGQLLPEGGFWFTALPKTYRKPFGGGEKTVPNGRRDTRTLALRRSSVAPGSPYEPTSNPMLAGVGPGSYVERAKVPDLTAHGDPRIVPLRVAANFSVAKQDLDPRGLPVVGTDGRTGGTVKDLWVDRGEGVIRYLEVDLASGGRSVLLPITFALIDKGIKKHVKVEAITAAQFADVPKTENPEQITYYEEERITTYYGGGLLYATANRGEPLL